MVTQLQTWYIITIKENLTINSHFLAPRIDTLDAHISTFARQPERRQVECKYHGVMVTNDDKVEYFVSQMYVCGLFEKKFLDDWEESSNNLWGATQPHFTK